MGTKVGTLEIEMAANIARLTEDFAAAKAEVNKSVGDIQRTVSNMQADMNASMAKVGESLKFVTGAFAAVAAVAAGGAIFKESVDESVKLTKEANAMAKALGISATEASVLNVALGDIYQSSETMLAANKALTKELNSNEGAFKALGVSTRDQNGNYRNSLDIMLDVNKRLLDFKEGTDRNIEGTKVYGKAWGEVSGILKLNSDLMEQSRQKSNELGLVVGQENVAAVARYRAAMNDVGDVISAVKKTIGDALMPILAQLGEWFSTIGPAAVLVIKGAIGGLAAVFQGLILVAQIAGHTIMAVWESLKAMVSGGDVGAIWSKTFQQITADAEATQKHLQELFSAPTQTQRKEGGESSDGKSSGSSERMAAWKSELEARKEAEGQFFKSSLAEDEAFWRAKLANVDKGSKDEIAIKHELFGIHKQLAVQKFNDEQEALKNDMAAARAGSAERIAIAAEAARRVGETYGWESKEYMAAIREIKKAADDFDKEQQKLAVMRVERTRDHNVAMIGMERDHLALQKNLGQISSLDEIAALKKLKEQEYQVEVQAQQDKIALMKEEGVAKQQQLDELAKMKDKHDSEMMRLDNQRVAAIKNNWTDALGIISSTFEQSINGMIQGTQNWNQVVNNMGQNIAAEAIKRGVKWVTNELANILTVKTAHITAESLKQTASDKGTQGAIANSAASSTVSVTNAAVTTGANVGAKQAESDGWWAIAEGFAAMGIVMGMLGSIKSSAGGEWQVPSDRLNLVHKDETILPAHIAGPLRNLVEGGGSGAGGGTVHINTSGGDFIHKNDLARLLKQMNRDFVFSK